MSSECTRRQLFRRVSSHLISLARLYFSPFESQLRDLFEVFRATIPNSKFKMRNNFLFFLFFSSREDGANRNKKQVNQFNSMLLERRDVTVIAKIRLPSINQPLNTVRALAMQKKKKKISQQLVNFFVSNSQESACRIFCSLRLIFYFCRAHPPGIKAAKCCLIKCLQLV